MFCTNCGSKLPDKTPFCPNCGAKQKIFATDAGSELAKANADAGNIVEEANAEALKTAQEFHQSIKENQNPEEQATEATNIEQKAEIVPVEAAGDNAPKEEGSQQALPQLPQAEQAQLPDQVKEEQTKNIQAVPGAETQKKGIKISPAFIILCAAGLVIIVIALVFLLSGSARNGIKKTFMSDVGYFKSVEKNSLGELIDNLSIAYEDDILELADFYKSEFDLSADIKIKDEAREFLEQRFSNVELDWIEKAKAEIGLAMKDNRIRLDGNTVVNGEKLLDLDLILDLNNSTFFGNIPILSKKYAMVEIGDEQSISKLFDNLNTLQSFGKALPSRKTLRNLINKYLDIALDQIKEVKVYKDKTLNVLNVEGEYYMMKATLDEYVQKDMYTAILLELQNDKEIKDILVKLEATGYYGDDLCDRFDKYIKSELENINNKVFEKYRLTIYVDDNGDIIGQELLNDDETNGFVYRYVINDENFGFEAYYLKGGRQRTKLTVSGTKNGNMIKGRLNCYKKSDNYFSMDFDEIDIKKLWRGNPVGKLVYNIGSDRQAAVEFDLGVKKSELDITISEAGKTLIEAVATLKKSSASTIKDPSSTAVISSSSDLTDWIDSFSWKTLLDNAEDSEMPHEYYRKLEDISKDFSGTIGSVLYKYLSLTGLKSSIPENLIVD